MKKTKIDVARLDCGEAASPSLEVACGATA